VMNKKSLEGIIKSGALDQFHDRKVLLDNLEIILDWIKNSANADQGLFGGMETTIALKPSEPSTLMERLMMEQEVFKAFVSGNPLDGFYKYAKKGTFLSQIKNKAGVDHFLLHAYVKDIQRAKKKGFFVKIEDITDEFEFFVPDACGLQKFDLLIIHGQGREYESKRTGERKCALQISKIIKTSRERLQSLAGGSYSPEDTVVKVKKARYGEQKKADLERIKATQIVPGRSEAESVKQDVEPEDVELDDVGAEHTFEETAGT